jgi:septum formation protein
MGNPAFLFCGFRFLSCPWSCGFHHRADWAKDRVATPVHRTMILSTSAPPDSENQQLVLASGSPRRREILSLLGILFRVVVSDVDEEALHRSTPRATALAVALAKAQAVMELCDLGTPVLAADTVVTLDGELLLKPGNVAEAITMLTRLSGRTHEVITGVALGEAGGAVDLRASAALVTFRSIHPSEIHAYASTGDPMDKAGGYGIQSGAGQFVADLQGDFYTVMGLPPELVAEMLGHHPAAGMARLAARALPRPRFPLPHSPAAES